jgi:hypothetical protein
VKTLFDHLEAGDSPEVFLDHFPSVSRKLAIAILAQGGARGGARGLARELKPLAKVSPQRLVHYRDNWYLDAWCHLRGGLRSFAVDAILAATVLPAKADDVPEATMDVMKYGAECEVVGPEALRREVQERVGAVVQVYGRGRCPGHG